MATATAPTSRAADLSPKDVLLQAWKSGEAGDADAHLTYWADLTPADQAKQRMVVALLHAARSLQAAVTTRFGEAAGGAAFVALGVGLDETDLKAADVTLTGDRAMVDLKGAGPGKVAMVKTADGWKISPAVIGQFNPGMFAMTPLLDDLTREVRDGKYATVDALQNAARERMMAVRRR